MGFAVKYLAIGGSTVTQTGGAGWVEVDDFFSLFVFKIKWNSMDTHQNRCDMKMDLMQI